MNTIQDRLSMFLERESLSKSQFADSINMARAGITHIMSGRNMPSYEFIVNVMEVYPFLDIEWLLTGKGSMYKGDYAPENNDSGLFSTPPAPEVVKEEQSPQASSIRTECSQNHRISRILVCFDDSTYQEFS